MSDISRHRKAEAELLNLGRILDESINEIYVFDANTLRFLYVNRGGQENLQYTMDQLRSLTPVDIKPDYTPEMFAALMATLQSGERSKIDFETSILRKDGTRYPVEVHLQPSRFEQRDAFVAIILDITERKRTESNMRRLAQVFTDSVDAIVIKDLSGNIIEINAATERQYGWTPEELVGQSIKRLVPAEEHEQRDELTARCVRGEEVRGVESSRVTRNGEVLPVLLTLLLLTDDAGQPTGIAAISEDISRRKAVEEELRVKELAIHSAVTGVAFSDLDGQITYANPAFLKMFGYENASEVVGHVNRELASDESAIDEIMTAVKAQGYWQGEDIAKKKDGTALPIALALALMKDSHGQPVGMVATFIDISERRQFEEALQASEQRLRSIVDTAADPIVIINKSGVVETFNPAAERTFRYSADEVIGHNVKMLMPPPYNQEHDGYLARYLDTGEKRIIGTGREAFARRKDGSTFPVQLSVSEVDQLGIYTGIIRDLTDEKRSQERLLQSERLAAIGEAMAGLVHESRNAMASVQAQLRMLSRRVADRPELAQYIDGALESQFEVQTLFEEVREWAAPKKLKLQSCDLGNLLRETWQKLEPRRAGRAAELREHHESTDLTCEADPFPLAHVFRNIFENALAACDDPVEVDAEYAEVHDGATAAFRITIRDNGPGLSEEQRKRIFDAFYTTKTHGTGLGMPIAKRTMQAHGGDIQAGPGSGGAEFILTIPRKQA